MAKLQYSTISKRTVEALSVEKDTVFWDRELTGFGVRVYPSGRKSYIVNYRAGDGGRKAPTSASCSGAATGYRPTGRGAWPIRHWGTSPAAAIRRTSAPEPGATV